MQEGVNMVSVLTPRNTVQGIPTTPFIARLTATTQLWYTCPAGKKARFRGYVIPDAFGAGTSLHVVAASQQVSSDFTVVNIQSPFIEGDLEAGETLGYTQDSGTNASVDGVWSIQESPA